MPLQGEKIIPVRRKFAFYSFPAPGSSLKTTVQAILCFDFAYSELGKSLAIFLHTMHLDKENF